MSELKKKGFNFFLFYKKKSGISIAIFRETCRLNGNLIQMGISKKYPYQSSTLSLADTAKALGHPARIAMIRYLRQHQFGSNSIFQGLTTLSKTAITQHMIKLEKVGLVQSEYLVTGPVYYLTRGADETITKLYEGIM